MLYLVYIEFFVEAQDNLTYFVPQDMEFEYEKETIYEEVENLFRNKSAAASGTVGPDNTLVKSKDYTKSELSKQSSSSDENNLKSHSIKNILPSTKTGKDNYDTHSGNKKEAFVTYIIAGVKQVPLQVDGIADSFKQSTVHHIKEKLSKPEELSAKVIPTPTARKPPLKKQSVSMVQVCNCIC